MAGPASAVPAYPDAAITVQQPDGSTLTIRPAGDEYTGHFVTSDGYTVIKNADGYYTYAEMSADGRLVPGNVVATEPATRTPDTRNVLNALPKGLAPSNDRILPGMQSPPTAIMNTKAAVTNQHVLVIVIQFPDVPATYTLGDFENLMNQPGYDIYGSVHDFYLENSYGQFDLQGTVVGWYTASHSHDFYGYNDGNNWTASATLAKEAILAADAAGLDFSQFDNDNDGEVDGVFIVHSGPGAEVGYSDYPWSHSWGLAWAGVGAVTVDGKYLNRYTMQPEKHTLSSMVRIGVFCHEYGHAIGLPDLYDTDGSSNGIGSWCLMAGGSWNGGGKSPSHMSAWCKARLNFLSPVNILIDTTDVLIPDVENNPVVYRLWSEGLTGSEYYLAEYRRKTGFDGTLPGCGLAIWHIDDTRTNNEDETHRWVDLIEADNSENNSAGDVWLNKTFDSLSTPAAVSYSSAATMVSITVNSATCETAGLMVNFGIGIEPSCCVGMRGNIDGDPLDEITVGDITEMVDYMFRGGQIECPEEANVDGDALEEINIADLTRLVSYSFKSGGSPASCQ
jgi:M6 family metalloprotease-like protein